MTERNLVVVRHGERCDFVFNNMGISWMKKAFDSNGRYRPVDVNMPRIVPKRKDGWQKFASDTPLTEMGYLQSKLAGILQPYCFDPIQSDNLFLGRALRDSGLQIDYIYCSSALRCIQTAIGIMKGLGSTTLSINIEPGLFEWMQWCRGTRPSWMQPTELKRIGYDVNVDYIPILKASDLQLDESLSYYYERSYSVTKEILRRHPSGTVFLIAHGASLDTCTRQLCGGNPRSNEDFFYLLQNTPYLSSIRVTESQGQWKIVGSPIPPLTHSFNATYDSYQLTLPPTILREKIKKKMSQ